MGTMRPMRVFKGKKLPGHMGSLTVTVQNLEIVAVDIENNIILVKGNVPGAKNALVVVRSAVKNPNVIKDMEELVTNEVLVSTKEQTVENEVNTEEVSSEEVTTETTEVSENIETTEVNETLENNQETASEEN
jgi:large subunit ribosomal protein L3